MDPGHWFWQICEDPSIRFYLTGTCDRYLYWAFAMAWSPIWQQWHSHATFRLLWIHCLVITGAVLLLNKLLYQWWCLKFPAMAQKHPRTASRSSVQTSPLPSHLPSPEPKYKKSMFEKRYNTANNSGVDVLGDTIFIVSWKCDWQPQ